MNLKIPQLGLKLGCAAACALALAACSNREVRDEYTEIEPTPGATETTQPTAATRQDAEPAVESAELGSFEAPAAGDSELTGIVSCDRYLQRYRGCHVTIASYEPANIEQRYNELRSSLRAQLRDGTATPEQVDASCLGLTADMDSALNGRACASESPLADDSGSDD